MVRSILTAFLIIAILWVPVMASDVTARQAIDRLYMAGGVMPVEDMIIQLEVSSLSQSGSSAGGVLQPSSTDKVFYKRPNKLRVNSVIIDRGGPMDGKQVVIIRDGVNKWMYVSMGQYPVKKGADEPEGTSNLPFNIQTYPQDSAREYITVGNEDIDGYMTDVIRIVNPARPDLTITVWVDRTRCIPLKVIKQRTETAKQGSVQVIKKILYKDIKQLKDGRWMPFMLEIYENDVLQSVVVYKAISINVGLQDDLFMPMKDLIMPTPVQ